MHIKNKTLGINFNEDGEATINIWAPKVEELAVVLDSDQSKILLHKNEFGYWQGSTKKIKSGDHYKVSVDGHLRPDPASVSQPQGVHGPSQAFNLYKFKWEDHSWINPPLQQYIIYELHVGTFTDAGTFESLILKLQYLKDLGITAIEIMPVAQFPGSRNWGYDGVFPFAVQNSYGGILGLQNLINACHQNEIAVILDVVYNHVGPEGNYLGDFGYYFTDKYNTPWGKAINYDDAWCDGVRQFYIENVLMWFRDFHIDALRMDAVHAIKDFSPKHILQEIGENVEQLKKLTGKDYHLIAELDLNDVKYINSTKDGGYGMDAQWVDEFHHALRVASGEKRDGYYADFNGLNHLAKSYNDAYVYDGIYSTHRKKIFGNKANANPGKQFIVFSQNHDHVGNRMVGERTSTLVSFEMLKLMAAAVFISPYIPMLFMGEEYAEKNPFQYFVSHSDPELIEAVRKGRKAEFAYFQRQGEAPDSQDEKTFQNSKLQWNFSEQILGTTMLQYYKALIQLRKNDVIFSNLERGNLETKTDEGKLTLFLHRWKDGYYIWCFLNFSPNEQTIITPSDLKYSKILFDSASTSWLGKMKGPTFIKGNEQITIQAESILIFTSKI